MATIALYHGTHTGRIEAHVGQCWTPSEESAAEYGDMTRGIDLDTSGLVLEHIDDGYDHDANEAVGDDGEYDGDADIIIYDDEDPMQSEHYTYRMMTTRAADAVAVALSE